MMAVAEEEVAEGGGSSLGTGTRYTLPSGPSVKVVTVRSRLSPLFRPFRFLFCLAAIVPVLARCDPVGYLSDGGSICNNYYGYLFTCWWSEKTR